MTDHQQQNSTQSSQQERAFHSNMRMIHSQNLTPQIAVSYLFKWRQESKYIGPLLQRLFDLCLKNSVHYIPTIIFIMSLQNNQLFEKFCQKIAQQSFSHYLRVRWSYSTYLQSAKSLTKNIITRLDSCILPPVSENLSFQSIRERATQKLNISNYSEHVHNFFQKLFGYPQRLKKYQKQKRHQKVRQYLKRLSEKFLNKECDYIDGIAFPIDLKSNIVVNILTDFCFTFSTKERVPYKLVVQTISFEDAKNIKEGKAPRYKSQKEIELQEKQPYILPQTYFGTVWSHTKQQITKKSIYGNISSFQIKCYMVKSGDDLRQEYMAMQLISLLNEIFIKENIKIWMKPYSIIPYSSDSGLIQFIDDTRTISYLKEVSHERSLSNIYKQLFGTNWQAAVMNFIQSLAGYSLIQYLFDIKDRHNNNILIDVYGHMIHIDFSFMLSSSPGNMNFQRAPFKLTQDYMQLMQGEESDIFQHFKLLFFLGLKYLRKYKKQIMQLIMIMTQCKGMKCFIKFDQKRLEQKFYENTTDQELEKIVDYIIKDACNSYTTSQYDMFQWFTNKIEI